MVAAWKNRLDQSFNFCNNCGDSFFLNQWNRYINLKGQGSFENFWQNFQHYCNRRYFVQFSLRTIRQKSIVWSVFRFIFRIKWSPVAAIALIWRAINWLSLYFEKYTFSYLNGKSLLCCILCCIEPNTIQAHGGSHQPDSISLYVREYERPNRMSSK